MSPQPEKDEQYDSEDEHEYDTDQEEHHDILGFENAEAMDSVDEAWKHFKHSGEFYIHNVCLDQSAISHLMRRFTTVESAPKGKYVTKSIERVEMEACSFVDDGSTRQWLRFLKMLGKDLKEVFIIGIPNEFLNGDRQISLLRGLQLITPLERLAVDRADLRGRSMGLILQKFLTKSPNLVELRFNGCRIDNHMFLPFLQGVKSHKGLKRLDLDGWQLNDVELNLLVDALVASPSKQTLQCLDISKSKIGVDSFSGLALLLKHMNSLEELLLCSCFDLFEGEGAAESQGFQDFVKELGTNSTLKELWLNNCHILQPMASPLLKVLQDNSTLEVLRVEGMVVQKYHKYTSAWRWVKGKGPKEIVIETTVPLSI